MCPANVGQLTLRKEKKISDPIFDNLNIFQEIFFHLNKYVLFTFNMDICTL